ncbi:DUF485 domain-containing protein [Streptomyces sp. PKU-EA00015]|uniref:DUF485 domain-containing protein n=1 Tax=Streptomyces sp. PKU-EA00015 TaxID=2748326 RepID=UPI0015A4E086|nr:DUF485 domain-containing protein [Streptomyces sp. PKU-EA00015]NWF27283.1 DUF485 domain-containing protein [Streptomyces sp. PKU-EA00015]
MTSPFEPYERPRSYAPDPHAQSPYSHTSYSQAPYSHTPYAEPDLPTDVERLRAERRSKVLPVAAAVVGFYLLNALLVNVAGGLMAVRLFGHLNLGLVLALLQCVTTLLVCRWYGRYAHNTLDPLTERVRGGLRPRGRRR